MSNKTRRFGSFHRYNSEQQPALRRMFPIDDKSGVNDKSGVSGDKPVESAIKDCSQRKKISTPSVEKPVEKPLLKVTSS
jgi:hypothetical protein